MAERDRLKIVLGSYPHTAALKDGSLQSPQVALDFLDVEPIHKAFAPMARRQAYDVSEMAIVVALQAIEAGQPLVLLPAVVASRLQRGCLIYARANGTIEGADIKGKRVGVRAYTQTTGMWVRAALREDYGLATTDMQWLTRDPSHVAEYRDPTFVHHDDSGKSLPDQLRDGDIDAAILGNDLPKGAEFAPVIPDHAAMDRAWYDRHGFMPINHMIVATRAVVEAMPRAVAACYELARKAAAETRREPDALDPTLFGIEALRAPLSFIIEECRRQALLEKPLDVDDLLQPAARILEK